MTIQLPKDLESSVRAEVLSGHFASADDAVAEIVRDYFRRRPGQPPAPAEADQRNTAVGSLGAMRDAADELDEAVEHAMNLRQRAWRLLQGE